MKIIYVIGVFDLYHRGHLELLRRAKEMGDKLIVAINCDEMVTEYKRAPFFPEEDRLALINNCKYVDEAFIIRQYDNREVVKKYKIDIIVHGDDWEKESYLKQIRLTEAFMEEHNLKVQLLPYTAGISTSKLIENIRNSQA